MYDHIQFVALNFDDGTVGIMQFLLKPNLPHGTMIPGLIANKNREATDEAIQHEIDKSVFAGLKVLSWKRITFDALPTDRAYRNAWRLKGDKIEHDMAHAKELHRDHLRGARAVLFPDLDVQYHMADESGDTKAKARIAATKQKLRDVTQDHRIEAANTVDELKMLTIDALTA